MAGEVSEAERTDEWGPVCRGFRGSLPDSERGCVGDIRLADGVETAGGIVRMPVRHSSRIGAPPKEAP